MTMNIRDRVKKSKIDLMGKPGDPGFPFFAYLVLHLNEGKEIAQNTEIPTAGIDAKGYMTYNPEWMDKLNDDQIKFTLCHEVLHCLTPNMIVGTKDLNSNELRDNDMVICSDGKIHKVEKAKGREYKGKINIIKPRGCLPLEITPNHRVLTLQHKGWKTYFNNDGNKRNKRILTEKIWKESGKVTKEDYMIIPKIKPNKSYSNYILDFEKYINGSKWNVKLNNKVLNEDIAYFLGRFMGDGWTDKNDLSCNSAIVFSKSEEQYADRIVKIVKTVLGISVRKVFHKVGEQEEGVWRVYMSSLLLKRFLREEIGTYSYNKNIPDWILFNPDMRIVKSFINGMYDADGCISLKTKPKSSSVNYCTVNKAMALKLQRLLTRVNAFGSIFERRCGDLIIFGKLITKAKDLRTQYIITCRHKELFRILNIKYLKSRPTKYHIDLGDSFATKVTSNETGQYEGEVFNFKTAPENYLVNNLVVHNCALQHIARRGNRDHAILNISNDIWVNNALIQNGLTPPSDIIIPCNNEVALWGGKVSIKDIDKKFSESIYDELYHQMKQKGLLKEVIASGYGQKGKKGKGKGNGPKPLDYHEYGSGKTDPKSKREAEKLRQKWADNLVTAANIAKQKGCVPAGMSRIIDKLLNRKLNWRNILYKYITSSIKFDNSWSKFSKRSISTGIWLPGPLKESIDVVVAVDTSGSISDKELNEFLTEIVSIGQSFNNIEITIIFCDAAVHETYTVRNGEISKILGYKISGRGGTSHLPVVEWVNKNKSSARVLVSLTDGFSDIPEAFKKLPSSCDKIIVLTANSCAVEDLKGCGKVVKMED